MNFTTSITLKDPSTDKVRIRETKRFHEFVVPSNFATIPTNHTQSRIMRNAHINTHRRIPSTKELEYDTEEDDDHMPTTPISDEEDDENTPLAVLAFRKGFVVPDKVENVYPLIQHIPQAMPLKYIDNKYSQFHTFDNNQSPMHNLSAFLSTMHNPEEYPQQYQFYQLDRNYSYTSSSNSSISSISSTSESLTSALTDGRHMTDATFAREASTYHRRQSFI